MCVCKQVRGNGEKGGRAQTACWGEAHGIAVVTVAEAVPKSRDKHSVMEGDERTWVWRACGGGNVKGRAEGGREQPPAEARKITEGGSRWRCLVAATKPSTTPTAAIGKLQDPAKPLVWEARRPELLSTLLALEGPAGLKAQSIDTTSAWYQLAKCYLCFCTGLAQRAGTRANSSTRGSTWGRKRGREELRKKRERESQSA